MTLITVAEASQRLPELLSAAQAGEAVTIRSDSGRTFTLVVKPPAAVLNPDWPGYPHAGSAKGLIKIADDLDDPPGTNRSLAMIELTEHQQRDVDTQEQPTRVVDPRTGQEYLLIHREIDELVRGTLKPYGRGWDDPADDDLIRKDA